jgi:hypothetical protein
MPLGEDSPVQVLALDFGSCSLLEVLLRAKPGQVFHASASSAPAPSRSGRAAGISSGFHRPARVYRSARQGANFRFTADLFHRRQISVPCLLLVSCSAPTIFRSFLGRLEFAAARGCQASDFVLPPDFNPVAFGLVELVRK